MSIAGNWNLTMSTPMGEQTGVLAVVQGDAGVTATMTGPDGEVQACEAVKADGQALSWKIPVKRPIPLTLHFDVVIDGDTLTGKFRPGMFPPSPVSGVRA